MKDDLEDTNRCVCCGAIVPEGRMAPPGLRKEPCLHLWMFECFLEFEGGVNRMFYRCQRCGKLRVGKPVNRDWLL